MRLLACLGAVLGLAAIMPASTAEAQKGAPLHHAARVVHHKWNRAKHKMRSAGHHTRAKMHNAGHRMRARAKHHR
jgi:hypothetical protein